MKILVPLLRSDGGHAVEAVLAHEHGDQLKATVVDNCNGTYSLAFKIHAQGEWTLQTKASVACCSEVEAIPLLHTCLFNRFNARDFACHAVQVDGSIVESATAVIRAAYGPLAAAECVLLGSDVAALICGIEHEMLIQPAQWKDGELSHPLRS